MLLYIKKLLIGEKCSIKHLVVIVREYSRVAFPVILSTFKHVWGFLHHHPVLTKNKPLPNDLLSYRLCGTFIMTQVHTT